MSEFTPQPCPADSDPREWSAHQNELKKEHDHNERLRERRRDQKRHENIQTRIAIGVLVVATLASLVLVFVYRDAPEPISEDIKSLATALHVELPKRSESNWPTMDKETRALFRTVFLGATTAALGFLFRGFFKAKDD